MKVDHGRNYIHANPGRYGHVDAVRQLDLTVNVAFGLRVKRTGRAETEQRVREALAMVQMESLRDRQPKQLSGGQHQRIAPARALVLRPQVLLLDEPLGRPARWLACSG